MLHQDTDRKMVDTKGNVTLATTSGSIRDARNNGTGDDLANVFANTVNLFAVGGSAGSDRARRVVL